MQYKAAEAELTTLARDLQRELLEQESNAARVHSEYQQAKMEAETNDKLAKNGLVADLVYKTSKVKAELISACATRSSRSATTSRKIHIEPQLASKQAAVDQVKALAKLQARIRSTRSKCAPGFTGVLQQLPLEVGQRVTAGTNLARVADPTKLKAEIKIAETQAKDIQINQTASIDTRNGIVAGHVIRVDPAVEQGTVKVDVALDGELPKGARPDLSVDGTIELERLDNVIYVGRPAFGQENNTVGIFKLVAGRLRSRPHPGQTGPQLGQYDRNSERPRAGRPGHPVRYQRHGCARTYAPELNPDLRFQPKPNNNHAIHNRHDN